MKAISVLLLLLMAFRSDRQRLAKPNEYQGVYVFTDCSPAGEYKVLGPVTPDRGSMQPGEERDITYSELRDQLIQGCRKSYPSADGIIMYCLDTDATAIQFK